jgi:hypothetical protein
VLSPLIPEKSELDKDILFPSLALYRCFVYFNNVILTD